jgi:hypothetical protein
MEQKIHEFEGYIISLSTALKVNNNLIEDISKEINQNLYDKYNELLIKGYSPQNCISYTLSVFEDPLRLAEMFNNVYNRGSYFKSVLSSVCNKKTVVVAILTILLITYII